MAKKYKKVRVSKLDSALQEIFEDYTTETTKKVGKAVVDVSEETVREINQNAPRRKNGGAYAESWDYVIADNNYRNFTKTVVYAEEVQNYRLTHLLEKGHRGRDGDWVNGDGHLTNAEQFATEQLTREVQNLIKNE